MQMLTPWRFLVLDWAYTVCIMGGGLRDYKTKAN